MSDNDNGHGEWVIFVLFCLVLLGGYFYYSSDSGISKNVGYDEAASFVQKSGYTIEKKLGSRLICSHDKTTGDTLGVGFVLTKEGETINVIVCDYVERVYKWPDNDPLHKSRQDWVDTIHHLSLIRIIPRT